MLIIVAFLNYFHPSMWPFMEDCAPLLPTTGLNFRNMWFLAGLWHERQLSAWVFFFNYLFDSSFKLFLELEPQLRDIIHKFYESKYASCLKLLDEMKVGKTIVSVSIFNLMFTNWIDRITCCWTCILLLMCLRCTLKFEIELWFSTLGKKEFLLKSTTMSISST